MDQFITILKALPLSKKISIAFVLSLVVAGFAFMFIWSNQVNYQVLYDNLSPEDGGAVVAKLKERGISYRVEANGTIVMVPAEEVYELRLALAGDGLPNGGNVGFEIFDHTDFRTTKFVQELNYRRALQGELARTINQFKEVKNARVFIAIPKESLFVQETKTATASIQLDLRSNLPPGRLSAIIYLVANAVEGLEPEQVTVVDTKGRVIFKGGQSDDASALLNNTQLDYKGKLENEIKTNVQTMLEGIVGVGKAIVRVNAEIDFDKVTLNQEEYDPSSTVIRSQKNIEELTQTGQDGQMAPETLVDQRRGVVGTSSETQKMKTNKNVITNYEINKTIRTIYRPAGDIKRLSVAAVIDGKYKLEKSEDGTVKKEYIPRSEEELSKFEEMIKNAMGYNEDREDQVAVNSMAFSDPNPFEAAQEMENEGFNIVKTVGGYKRIVINLLLVVLVFLFVVRPLLKSMKNITQVATLHQKSLPPMVEEQLQIPGSIDPGPREKVFEITKSNPERTQQLLKGWLGE